MSKEEAVSVVEEYVGRSIIVAGFLVDEMRESKNWGKAGVVIYSSAWRTLEKIVRQKTMLFEAARRGVNS
jgi:hypothetical protein